MKKIKWVIGYFTIVLIFAAMYSILWERSPDSFIVNDDLNMTPFVEARNVLWGNEDYQVSSVTTLSKLKSELDALYTKMATHEEKASNTDEELKELTSFEKSVYSKMEEEREISIEKYKIKELSENESIGKEYVLEIERKEEKLKAIEDPSKRLTLIIELGDRRVEYANFRVLAAQKEYDVYSYILSNFGSFASRETINRVMELRDRRINLLKESSSLQISAGEVRGQISELLNLHYKKRKNRLGFVDFLYYSIGISTTTTFGDITANSKTARTLVGIQLILCVIVVGMFLNSLNYKRVNNGN